MPRALSVLCSRRRFFQRIIPIFLLIFILGLLAPNDLTKSEHQDGNKVSDQAAVQEDRTERYIELDTEPNQPRDGKWTQIPNTVNKFYVYSAYYDSRTKVKYIRAIAATVTKKSEDVLCVLHFDNEVNVTVAASKKVIRENWNLKYSAFFLLCPLPDLKKVPKQVSFKKSKSDKPSAKILVQNNEVKAPTHKKDMAVCVKPFHYEYNKVDNLLEFIELNRILGVNHFVFYNHTVGRDVDCLLRQYQRLNIVTVMPWQLNMISQKEIRTEGIFASLNDCLYRTMYSFRYVLVIDLDEFVMPYYQDTLPKMLETTETEGAAYFSFKNGFFYLQWPDDEYASGAELKFITLRKTRRMNKLHNHKHRSKYIVVPERVTELGNHFVWERIAQTKIVLVGQEVAFLHHYRICEFGGDACVQNPSVVDRRAYQWKDSLLKFVNESSNMLQKECNLNKRNASLVAL